MEQIAQLVRHHIDNAPEGGTLSLLGHSVPTHGYLVGGAGPALVFRNEADLRDHWEIVEDYVTGVVHHGHQYVGWWTDPETGKVYLDCSTWHAEAASADAHAVKRGEIAFYGIERGADVKTGSIA